MALTSPALTLAVDTLFGYIKPATDLMRRMGFTDFTKDAPGIDIKPGATIKYPLSSVQAASVYDADKNNYLTGGSTDWGTLTATHYLQGFDITGVNIDEGVNASLMKQRFSARAGAGIAYAAKNAIKAALDSTGIATSTSVKLPAVASAELENYDGLGSDLDWLDKLNSVLVVNGTEWARIKAQLHAAHLSATEAAAAQELGFKDLVVIQGLSARALIVPFSSIGFIARVPAIGVKYAEAGTETDEDSGLSVGIVVAEDQATNKQVVNGDLWFGVATVSAPAGAGTAGIVKVGTGS